MIRELCAVIGCDFRSAAGKRVWQKSAERFCEDQLAMCGILYISSRFVNCMLFSLPSITLTINLHVPRYTQSAFCREIYQCIVTWGSRFFPALGRGPSPLPCLLYQLHSFFAFPLDCDFVRKWPPRSTEFSPICTFFLTTLVFISKWRVVCWLIISLYQTRQVSQKRILWLLSWCLWRLTQFLENSRHSICV